MSTSKSTDSGPEIVNGMHEVASNHLGKTLLNNIINTLTGGDNVRRAEYYMSRSRTLLQQHITALLPDDQTAIREQFMQ